MPVLILLAFNGFVLYMLLSVFLGFSHNATHFEQCVYALISLGVVAVLAFLFNSPAGQWLFRLTSGARNAIGREHARLDPIVTGVQERLSQQLGLPPMPVKLMILDDPLPNAFAIGRNTLILSRTLYETASDDELAAVIAHEFAHLHNGDSQKLGIALGVSIISLTIAAVSGFILTFTTELAKNSKEAGGYVIFFGIVFIVFAAFFRLFVWVGNGILRLVMLFVGRKQEYEADKFAVKAGYGAGMVAFLDKIKNMEFGKATHIIARLYDTHPPIMLRIGELEKLMEV